MYLLRKYHHVNQIVIYISYFNCKQLYYLLCLYNENETGFHILNNIFFMINIYQFKITDYYGCYRINV